MKKKILTSLMLVLSVLFGSTVLAAPAQAIAGTTVYVYSAHGNGWTKTTNINDWDKIIHEGETANNVAYFCPPSTGWELEVFGPSGTRRILAPGACYTPTKDGLYQVGVYYAGTSA